MKINEVPLIVDLDYTLVNSDTLVESSIKALSKNFLNLFKLIYWLFLGKIFFKNKVSENFSVDPKLLPYRSEVLDFITNEKRKGRKIFLCSGAGENQVRKVHEHLGLFNDYFSSSFSENLIKKNKANLLIKKFGVKKFDYIGDSIDDIIIWEKSNTVHTVNISNKVKKILIKKNIQINEIVKNKNIVSHIINFISAIRLYQWSKNLLVFLPIVLSQEFTEENFLNSFIAFTCFSFVASSVYVFNDIFDIQNDRSHPRKKYRMIASGKLKIPFMVIVAIVSLFVSFITSLYFLNYAYTVGMTFYLFLNFLYTLILKKIFLLDVVTLSIFYVIRIICGGLSSEINLSNWLFVFSAFFFIFLALIKRLAELLSLKDDNLATYGRSYNKGRIALVQSFTLLSSVISIFLLVLYFLSEKVLTLYQNEYILLLICPLFFYWQLNIFFDTKNKKMFDDPILYIIRNKKSWLLFFAMSAIIISQMKIW